MRTRFTRDVNRKEHCMAGANKAGLSVLTKKLDSIKAKEVMTVNVLTTSQDATLVDIAHLMIEDRISGLPVLDKGGKVVGVITATDLFIVMDMIKSGDIVEGEKKAVSNPTVKFAMSTEIVKITPETTLSEIIALMKYKNVHTLPVFKGDKMVGVIGRRDVLRNFYAAIEELHL